MDTNERAYYPVKWRVDLPSIACLLLGLGVVLAFFTGGILVIGSHVVHAWLISSALLAASLVIWWLGSRKQRGYNRDDQHRSWMRSCATLLLVAVVGVGSALGALQDMNDETFVLEPEGPDGCRALVRESSFLMAGGGEVYTVGASGIGRPAGDWTTDDGYRPIEAGFYTLTWSDDTGYLSVSETFGPSWSEPQPISCR